MSIAEQPERRRAPRINFVTNAQVEAYAGSIVRNCITSDISQGGAKLHVDDVESFPDAFKLHLKDEGLSLDCVVVWRSQSAIGVIFGKPPKI